MQSVLRPVAWLFTGVMLGWLLLPTPLAVCGMYSSAAAPAWVQAIGSILAIVVAALIPLWQERSKRSNEDKQLSIATLRLRSNLDALSKAAKDRAEKIEKFKVMESTASVVTRLLQNTYLTEASSIVSYVDTVHHMEPEIQGHILGLLEEFDQYVTEHSRVYDSEENQKLSLMEGCQAGQVTRLKRIAKYADDAAAMIRKLADKRKAAG